jgi:class 3 adenylate cyclase/TolB-like protein
MENEFLNRLTGIVDEHISDEQFGVSELAYQVGMSRSNLLRKVKKLTNKSASQFIREVRLKRAMEMLRQGSWNVSEVSFNVGFGSTSYFIKCFRDHFGYPPGEVGKSKHIDEGPGEIHVPSEGRQLAAIMFTDIRDYTSLMQRDEQRAIEFRNRHREVFNAITKKYKGKILQYYGDGTLSTFSSAIDAVRCGIEMQLAFQEDPRIPVRVGVHTGDIKFTKDDIIGDGVNIASRVESLAVAGSVFISDKVYDEVKNQPGIQSISMGVFNLKNVDKPIEVFAIANPGLVVPDKAMIDGKTEIRSSDKPKRASLKKSGLWWALIPIFTILAVYIIYESSLFDPGGNKGDEIIGKSIAVLPFINDSDDSSNIHIINGLMESTLINLQKIGDLRVISRTSVEKYRTDPGTIPEIADELNVSYLVEGSGQKIDDQIMLNIQLIEASTDKHLWGEQYVRKAEDIFQLQQEVARDIAAKIKAVITPEEEARIEKVPTENLEAYDYFLKGRDLFFEGGEDNWLRSIGYFRAAVSRDSTFAWAYADIAIAYYMLESFHSDKRYSDSIDLYADLALLHDPQLPQSLIAKAFFHMNHDNYEMAVPYLEKALEYNPNSALVIRTLSDFYANFYPDSEKYLEYALKGIQINIAAYDSTEASYLYLHVSNAFVQSGFMDQAMVYINRSLDYNPENIYSHYVKPYIQYANNQDLEILRDRLLAVLKMDTNRLDVLQEVGKVYYYLRDYESSYRYYRKFQDIKNEYNLQMYPGEDAKIALVLAELGMTEEADLLFKRYKQWADDNTSIYKHLSLAAYHAFYGNSEKALEHLKLFSQEENFHYWIVLFLDIDPLFDNIKDNPRFTSIMKEIERQFRVRHEKIKAMLEKEELI